MPEKRPNILIVQADQMAAAFLPFHGHPVVRAPNMAALAEARVAPGGELLWHAGVNALIAPLVLGLVARLITKLNGDDGRRLLRLDPRGYPA